jgi:hypothetical protein
MEPLLIGLIAFMVAGAALALVVLFLNTTNNVHGNSLYAAADIYAQNGAYIKAYEAANIKYGYFYHDGTDMQIDASSGDIKLHGGVLTVNRGTDSVDISGAAFCDSTRQISVAKITFV